MARDLTGSVRVDPALAGWQISIPAFRLEVDDEPDSAGNMYFQFKARVQCAADTPPFGMTLVLIDDLGIPTDIDRLNFTKTIDELVYAVSGWGRASCVPSEIQLVLDRDP